MIRSVKGKTPKIDPTAFVHDSAVVTGDVEIRAGASVWPCAVIRGDMNRVVIGENSNVQDNSVIHTKADRPCIVEDNVLIAHNVNLHSCHIKEDAMVGIAAIVLDGAVVEEGAFVGAGALVPPERTVPAGKMAMGHPAKVRRDVTPTEKQEHDDLVKAYAEEAQAYKQTEKE